MLLRQYKRKLNGLALKVCRGGTLKKFSAKKLKFPHPTMKTFIRQMLLISLAQTKYVLLSMAKVILTYHSLRVIKRIRSKFPTFSELTTTIIRPCFGINKVRKRQSFNLMTNMLFTVKYLLEIPLNNGLNVSGIILTKRLNGKKLVS